MQVPHASLELVLIRMCTANQLMRIKRMSVPPNWIYPSTLSTNELWLSGSSLWWANSPWIRSSGEPGLFFVAQPVVHTSVPSRLNTTRLGLTLECIPGLRSKNTGKQNRSHVSKRTESNFLSVSFLFLLDWLFVIFPLNRVYAESLSTLEKEHKTNGIMVNNNLNLIYPSTNEIQYKTKVILL